MDESAAVDALDDLGLSTYEAKVFIGLQKLGAGTAREVAEVTDVPRSQVYGAADALAELGLVDVQQGSPTRYRPVDTDDARDRLVDRLASTADRAFEYIDAVSGECADRTGRTEAIWTAAGADNVAARAAALVEESETRVMYGTSDVAYLEPTVAEALSAAADRGVEVVVVSVNEDLGDAVGDVDGVRFQPIPSEARVEMSTGRVLVSDGDTMLLSVVPAETLAGVEEETAFWSADTALATVLVTIIDEWMGDYAAAYADD